MPDRGLVAAVQVERGLNVVEVTRVLTLPRADLAWQFRRDQAVPTDVITFDEPTLIPEHEPPVRHEAEQVRPFRLVSDRLAHRGDSSVCPRVVVVVDVQVVALRLADPVVQLTVAVAVMPGVERQVPE